MIGERHENVEKVQVELVHSSYVGRVGVAAPDGAGQKLLRDAADAMRLSARGYHRVLKVARTIADLDGAETIGRPHLAEALAYRALNDRLAAAA